MKIEVTERQYEIIEAAGKILTEKGVGGLTIKNLSAQMNFTESAVYRHFRSKEDIIAAMLNFLCENIEIRFDTIMLQYTEPEEKLKAAINSQFDFFSKNPHFVVAVFSDGLLEESEKINNIILKIMSFKSKFITDIIKDGQAKMVFNEKISSEKLVHIVMGSFRLFMFKWRLDNFKFDLQTEGSDMMNSVISLIRKCNEK